MKLTGAKSVIKSLEIEGTEVVFGYPGAAICPVYDALLDSSIRHILVRQEQGAAHMASGYARVTGRTGVCIVTSGPGATNLITGIATAYMDSIPLVAITGQVSTDLIGRDVFQEVDITGATAPFCKHNYLVKNAEDLPRILKSAFHIASTGRPGPVLVDIPIDVQQKEINFSYPSKVEIRSYKPNTKGHSLQIKKASEAINKAKRPAICAGGGVISADASEELRMIAEKASIPITNTLMGKGCIPYNHDLCLGMVGSHGVYAANQAVRNSDLLLIVGARVGDRAMGTNYDFARDTVVVHIDIDPAEIGKNIGTEIPIVGDVKLVLEELLGMIKQKPGSNWLEQVKSWRKETEADYSAGKEDYVIPQYVLAKLSELVHADSIIATEVGQNQIWAANHFKTVRPKSFITSGGLGTMGYGLPAAMGAKIACPDRQVLVVSGDGSFQMNMQELGTIKQNGIGVKIILFNNYRLGMVREIQKNRYGGRYSHVELTGNPDFVKLAASYDIDGIKVTRNEDVEGVLKEMLKNDKPYLAEFIIDPEESTL